MIIYCFYFFFFFNDTATTEIYTLSLHDALPIFELRTFVVEAMRNLVTDDHPDGSVIHRIHSRHVEGGRLQDRKSTRLNSSHDQISYAVFCLKKKNNPDGYFQYKL